MPIGPKHLQRANRPHVLHFSENFGLLMIKCSDLLVFIMSDLTFRQAAVLHYLQDFSRTEGYWPSIRDIQQHFGFRSTNAVAGHLRALEAKKAIRRIPGQARTFRITPGALHDDDAIPEGTTEVIDIPIYGSIAAGYPDGVEQGDAIGRIQIGADTIGRNRSRRSFALKVRGESMINAGIFEGDTVILDPRQPRNNDIVAALIDGETTLKRFIQTRNQSPFLKAENPDYPEIYPVGELIIQGVALAVVRRI